MPENNQPASEARKSLPQNIEAEQTVLAACLLSTGVFEEVSLKLKPESFFRPAHKMIFEAMREMNARSSGTAGGSWWPAVSAGAC